MIKDIWVIALLVGSLLCVAGASLNVLGTEVDYATGAYFMASACYLTLIANNAERREK